MLLDRNLIICHYICVQIPFALKPFPTWIVEFWMGYITSPMFSFCLFVCNFVLKNKITVFVMYLCVNVCLLVRNMFLLIIFSSQF